ncbi:Glycine cleavage system H protein [Planctomycetes bacterium Pla163]|uniref:Glycine cleavage system H protein n=1 Tax=Rohdeia mirabilis TaxID=2528008 RepID=A0A518CYV1_9BACT|nr:Glycine cleavage system H protein [Planctomycetes bacterium Pla163]
MSDQATTRPDDRKYLKSHEWMKIDGDTALIGITDHAVDELCSGNEGDLVYCDLPEVGRLVEAGQTFGEIESVKAVADLNCPVDGEVVEVNAEIEDHLEILSRDPWNEGWMIRVRITGSIDESEMMDAAGYNAFVAE